MFPTKMNKQNLQNDRGITKKLLYFMTILPDLIKILFLVKKGIKLYKKYYRDYK